ncbi:hypothetical protein OROMI_016226 [Orobanche minor]
MEPGGAGRPREEPGGRGGAGRPREEPGGRGRMLLGAVRSEPALCGRAVLRALLGAVAGELGKCGVTAGELGKCSAAAGELGKCGAAAGEMCKWGAAAGELGRSPAVAGELGRSPAVAACCGRSRAELGQSRPSPVYRDRCFECFDVHLPFSRVRYSQVIEEQL